MLCTSEEWKRKTKKGRWKIKSALLSLTLFHETHMEKCHHVIISPNCFFLKKFSCFWNKNVDTCELYAFFLACNKIKAYNFVFCLWPSILYVHDCIHIWGKWKAEWLESWCLNWKVCWSGTQVIQQFPLVDLADKMGTGLHRGLGKVR